MGGDINENKVARVVSTTWGAVMIITSWILAFALEATATIVLYPFVSRTTRHRICGNIFRACSALCVIYLNPFWGLRVVKYLPKRRPGRTILMCNHLSNADPFFLCTALFPVETKWISKSSLFQVPFGGWCMSLAGDIPVYFTKDKGGWGTKKGSVSKMMEHCARLLKESQPIVVFPEGVRAFNPYGPLEEFKDGFFQLAMQEGAEILPMAITGTNRAWPRDDSLLGVGTAYVSVGEFIKASDYSVEELKALVRRDITRMRDAHPDMQARLLTQPATSTATTN